MEMLGGKEAINMCRKPEIMADAAYAILCRDSKTFTGNFNVDDDILKQEGITDFTSYAFDPNRDLMPDFFLDEFDESALAKLSQNKPITASEKASKSASGESASIQLMFESIKVLITPEAIEKAKSLYAFHITIPGGEPDRWYIDLKSETGGTGKGDPPTPADVTFTLNADNFRELTQLSEN